MNIKMNKIDQRRKFLKEKAYSLYKKISSVFTLTSVDLMNNFLFRYWINLECSSESKIL